ncbi:polysaccharide biosynthesis protein [Lactobacillus sanfranciscensis]|nr:polysaccharide biosynthesis protein [Fructilactobacillus sanfranciscensis]NDR75308.1 polysaccharide biosynthesis protein [Fructilactobacillus sanfranciscensis]NDR96116.1 polysaccharide biosynthesis protein [Fructilactobacillus sanfranciscensis]NDS03983.1 polysaccharide biosynthesis protein [Fructilactobacillus sanfranciscensis]POH20577.1 transporter [Fructilactobacillus sanfranciscensis]POH23511.1 transporter [Fructilactobacillus sanfranciscensis]
MLKGSAWMTVGSILSRILGALYIIPWRLILGASLFPLANSLYTQGYNIYSFALIVAVAGIPSAISKQVAHYNALNEYGVGVQIYKKGLSLAILMGIVSALILWVAAPILTNGDKNVIPVIHSLAWAVLVIPTMSLTRGFFQGYNNMAPSAISQFVEQLARVIYMLLSAFLVLKVMHGSWVTAVSQSTFAACIGAIFGFLVLVWFYWKNRNYYQGLIKNSNNKLSVPTNQLYCEIISQATPFIILGAGVTIFSLIDQFTFFHIMRFATNFSEEVLQINYAIFAGNANKLTMIVVSLASSIGITVVPLLSEAFTKKNKKALKDSFSNALVLFEFVMIPASLGMAAIAGPLNRTFYGTANMDFSSNVLAFSSIESIPIGLFVVVAAIMQGVSQNKKAVKLFAYGTLAKFVTQYPLVYLFGAFGTLMSTMIGFFLATWLMIRALKHEFGIEKNMLQYESIQIIFYSIVMYFVALVSVYGLNWFFSLFTTPFSSIISLIVTGLASIFGAIVYAYFMLKTGLAEQVLGKRVGRLKAKFNIK